MLVGLRPAVPRAAAPGRPRSLLACTVDEEFTHTGSSRLAADQPRGGPGHRGRADLAQTWSTATKGRIAVEDPDAGRGLPQLDARTWASTRSTGWAASSTLWPSTPAFWLRSAPDPIVGPPSLSVGRIEGGQSVNIVPDWCEIEIDRRLIPGETPEQRLRGPAILTSGWERWRESNSTSPGSTCPPWFAGWSNGSSPLKEAVAQGTGQRASRSWAFLTAPTPAHSVRRAALRWSSGPATSPRPTPG